MKKKMLALATALLLAVSCFAAFPASAAGTPLTLSIDYSASVNSGDTVTATVYASSSAALQGFDLAFSADSNIEVVMETDPAYKDEIATSGLDYYLDSYYDTVAKVYHLVYAGFRDLNGQISLDETNLNGIVLNTETPTPLFSFQFIVNADAGTTIEAPLSIKTKDFAYKDTSTTYALYETTVSAVSAITVNTPAPTVITSDTYLVDETTKLIKGVKPGTSVNTFIANTTGSANAVFWSPWEYQLSDYDNEIMTTGTIVDLDGDLTTNGDTYGIVIYGDAMCEGLMSTAGAGFAYSVADEFELGSDTSISGFRTLYTQNVAVQNLLINSIMCAINIWGEGQGVVSTPAVSDMYSIADQIELGTMTYDDFYSMYESIMVV